MFSLQTIFGSGQQFYTLLDEAALAAYDSTKALHSMMKASDRLPALDAFKLARQRERTASDKIGKALVDSFITPIEREDIESLGSALYKIPKQVEKFSDRYSLAVKHLASEDASRLLVFGRGPQSGAHVEAISAIRPIEHVDVVGRDRGDITDLIRAADVICCCTTSPTPLFDGSLVQDHATVVAIGSHDPEQRETDDALTSRATVVVESRTSALREAGDVVAPLQSGALTEDRIITLAELVNRTRTPQPGPRLFKSSGMSWEDAVIAGALA